MTSHPNHSPGAPSNQEIKFAADRMVGGLAKWLRLLGMDTIDLVSGPDHPHPHRILVTRRSRPLATKGWPRVINIESDRPRIQLAQVIKETPLLPEMFHPLSRCTICNTLVKQITALEAARVAPQYILTVHDRFTRCPDCRRVYWPGTHYDRIMDVIRSF